MTERNTDKKSSPDNNDSNWLSKNLGFLITVFIAAAGLLVLYFYNFNEGLSASQEDWGAFGDYMGGLLNPFIAFLAFLALLKTIEIQSKELKLTREELEESTDALNKQHAALKLQIFESTFFRLVDLYNQTVSLLEIKTTSDTSKGRDFFLEANKEFGVLIKNELTDIDNIIIRKTILINGYEAFYSAHGHRVGHYFRILYNIFKYIDDNRDLLDELDLDPFTYSNIIRAQISKYELSLLFYNCLSRHGEGMIKYIKEYKLLKHLEKIALLLSTDFDIAIDEELLETNE